MRSDLFRDAARASDFEEEADQASGDGGAIERASRGTEPPMTDSGGSLTAPPPPASSTPAGESAAVGLSRQARGELIRPGEAEKVRALWGWRRWFGLRPGPQEQEHLDAERVIRQATWSRAVNVLVANKTGSVGKTTTSLVLGGTLARVRGGGVCVFEVSDDVGALEKRAEGTPMRGMGELMEAVERVGSYGELAGYTAPQTSHARVIGSVGDRPELTGEHVQSVRTLLDQHYAITVSDSGNNTKSSAFTAAVHTADQLVVPTLPTSVAVIDALSVLERVYKARPALAESAVVVINHDGRPEEKDDARRAREQLAQVREQIPTIAVMEVSYDAHIGKGGEISIASLTRESTVAWTRAAAEVSRRLLDNVND